MIKTVTLNPAVDKTVEVNNFTVGTVNRISAVRLDAGGKGINVAKVLRVLNGHCLALGILAGRNGHFIKEHLDKWGIPNDFVFTAGETRTNLKAVDPIGRTFTDINEPGVEIPTADLELLERKIFADLAQGGILVLSGSVPAKTDPGLYKDWIEQAEKAGARTILDADGKLLQEGIKARPFLIKPNLHELEQLLNSRLVGPDAIAAAAQGLLATGINMMVVSMGAEGAVFVQKERALYAEALPVEPKSTVGAGDAMVAALSLALAEGYTLEKTVTLAMATSAAQVMTAGTLPPEPGQVRKLENMVSYRRI